MPAKHLPIRYHLCHNHRCCPLSHIIRHRVSCSFILLILVFPLVLSLSLSLSFIFFDCTAQNYHIYSGILQTSSDIICKYSLSPPPWYQIHSGWNVDILFMAIYIDRAQFMLSKCSTIIFFRPIIFVFFFCGHFLFDYVEYDSWQFTFCW